jgi:Skp family chaperone for outer membrane proteins
MKEFQGDLKAYTKKLEGKSEELENKSKEVNANGDKAKEATTILKENDERVKFEKQYSEHRRKHI